MTDDGETAQSPKRLQHHQNTDVPEQPLKVVKDLHGRLWICPANVDEHGDLAAQGCWRCGTVTAAD